MDEIIGEITRKLNLGGSRIRDFEDFRSDIAKTSEYIRKEFGRLPFSTDTVREIDEPDIDWLQSAFGLPDAHKYAFWGKVFYKINVMFIEPEKYSHRPDPQDVVSSMGKTIPKNVPFGPLFLACA